MVSPVSITHIFNGDTAAADLVAASQLDTALGNLASTINSEIAERQRTVRDGSGLAPQVVRFPSLHPEITALLTAGGLIPLQSASVCGLTNQAALSGLLTIDGYTLIAADRILLTGQTNPLQNGLWVAAAGAWTRPADSVTGASLAIYSEVNILNGTSQSGSTWILKAAATVDSSAQVWVQFSGLGTVVPVGRGGTGATTAPGALTNLGVSAYIQTLVDDVDASAARTTLGIPTSILLESIATRTLVGRTAGGTGVASAVSPDDVGVIADGSSSVRDFSARFADRVNVKDFGTTGNGVADDRAAVNSAATTAGASGEIILPPGNYLISSNLTIACFVRFYPGAKFTIPNGVTVTFSKGIIAGIHQIFTLTGTGLAVLTPAYTPVGYPEWWGAVTGGTDCLAAINYALVALSKTELQGADYYVSGTVNHFTPNHWLCGRGSTYDSVYGTQATRIIRTDGTGHVLQVGPSAQPGGTPPAQWPLGIKTTGINVTRSVAPVVSSACDSIRVSYTLEAFFDDMRGDDSMNGWEFVATVSNRLFNCKAKRTSAGTGGTDSWRGFYINGIYGALFAGGNASLYIAYSHADDTRASVVNGIGFYADGSFTDCFLSWCETVTCTVGIQVTGNSAAGLTFSNTDFQIQNCINDAFKTYGIYISNLAVAGSVEVIGGYEGPAVGATAARFVSNSQASVHMVGGQLVMGVAVGCLGVYVDTSSGVRVNGTQILEAGTTAVALVTTTNCDIQPIIKNRSVTGGAGVQLSGTPLANYIKPTILGKASGTSLGIQVVGVADARNEYNCSGIDSSCIAGGSGNKLTRNGVQITATGLSGTNLVSGVMT
jgi:Pectate lyase superfamily protein